MEAVIMKDGWYLVTSKRISETCICSVHTSTPGQIPYVYFPGCDFADSVEDFLKDWTVLSVINIDTRTFEPFESAA